MVQSFLLTIETQPQGNFSDISMIIMNLESKYYFENTSKRIMRVWETYSFMMTLDKSRLDLLANLINAYLLLKGFTFDWIWRQWR